MLRNTKQNSLILDIINNSYSHPTAYDVYLECVKIIPNISLGTVYRNLKKLVDNREIQRIEVNDNIVRYDKNICHDHFVCVRCNKIIDLSINNTTYNKMIDGNKVLNLKVFYDGICKDCLKLDEGDDINGTKGK